MTRPPDRADDVRFLLPSADTRWVRADRTTVAARVSAATEAVVMTDGRRSEGGTGTAGWTWRDVLVRGSDTRPRLIVPTGRPNVARYVFGEWHHPPRAVHRVRSRVAGVLVGRGVVPPGTRLAVGTRRPGPPYLLDAAGAHGIPGDADWFLALGDGDEFQRGAFHVLPRGADAPAWIVKFGRVPGDDEPFRAEAAAYDLLERRAPAAAGRAPQRLGRCDVDVPAAVETAARGPGLHAVLDDDGSRAAKLALIAEVVRWIDALGSESTGPVHDLETERDRLRHDVLPEWPDAPADLAEVAPGLRPVLAHHDAGSWNMVATPSGVMVLDWESARYPAMPLWDVLYFLTDALVALHGPATDDVKVARALALLRGELPESTRLFDAMRASAARAGVAVADLGAIATLAWLHHGTSPARRRTRAERVARPDAVGIGLLTRLAEPWLRDPALGVGWAALPR